MKIRPVGAELFHGDGETDMTKLIIACRHFANAPCMRRRTSFPWVFVKQAASEFEIADSDHMSTRTTNTHQSQRENVWCDENQKSDGLWADRRICLKRSFMNKARIISEQPVYRVQLVSSRKQISLYSLSEPKQMWTEWYNTATSLTYKLQDIILSVTQQPTSGLGRLTVEVSRSHTIRHTHTHTAGRTALDEWSASHRDRYVHKTRQTEHTKI